jgi:hypothetical protein
MRQARACQIVSHSELEGFFSSTAGFLIGELDPYGPATVEARRHSRLNWHPRTPERLNPA